MAYSSLDERSGFQKQRAFLGCRRCSRRRRIIQNDEEVEPLGLGAASYEAVLKRVAPVAAGAVLLAIVIWLIRRG